MDLKEAEILGADVHTHWYYRAKGAALLHDLSGYNPSEILDIGAGSGYFARLLLERTHAARAVCVDTGYATERDETWCGRPLVFRRAITRSAADLVLALDVLEHVPDDVALLRSYVAMVASGTRFVISVPAFNFLWSGHDEFLGHRRRYTRTALERVLTDSGLDVDWSHYYYAALFPLAAALRLAERMRSGAVPHSQLRRHGAMVNAALSAICAAERPIMRANRLFGLTVFAGCHKP